MSSFVGDAQLSAGLGARMVQSRLYSTWILTLDLTGHSNNRATDNQ
jgi:hypothetical protein